MMRLTVAALAACASLAAGAADDLFHKTSPGSKNGFLAATDPTYVKECGSCHFPYSPGLLPARSWKLQMSRMDKHFGESVSLDPATREHIAGYLDANAADRSPYAGSKIFMSRVKSEDTPYRFNELPVYREMHRIILEVISIKAKVSVRTLSNCGACHQYAPEGSFGYSELVVPGLTRNVSR
jgi:hypothetical protein